MSHYQLQWSKKYCSGPPNVILSSYVDFNTSNTSPFTVESVISNFDSDICGASIQMVNPSQCCYSNFNPSPIPSVESAVFYSSVDQLQKIPNAKDFVYASIHSNQSLYGYYEISILCDNLCHLGFKCTSTQLQLYDSMDCTDQYPRSASSDKTYFVDSTFGNITVAFNIYQNTFIEWVTVLYWQMDYSTIGDLVFVVFGVLSMLLNIATICIEFFYRLDKPIAATIQVLWLFYNITWFASSVYTTNSFTGYWISEAADILYGISTLGSVLYTAELVGNLLNRKIIKYLLFLFIFAANLALNFPYYLDILYQFGQLQFPIQWYAFSELWIYFMFVFNLSPNMYFLYKYYEIQRLAKDRSCVTFLLLLMQRNISFALLTAGHLLNLLGFIILDTIMTWTILFGSDKALNAGYMVETFLITIHFVLVFATMKATKVMITASTSMVSRTTAIASIAPHK